MYVLESGGSPHGGMGKFQFSQVADAEVYLVIGHKLGKLMMQCTRFISLVRMQRQKCQPVAKQLIL
ncbi:hypothetical protein [Providencia hangzhouensis]|uniref:hypothetical protein n=1 Tax=Providencia hangzhouensis TaxID=3031799 RepID=UPI003F68CD89